MIFLHAHGPYWVAEESVLGHVRDLCEDKVADLELIVVLNLYYPPLAGISQARELAFVPSLLVKHQQMVPSYLFSLLFELYSLKKLDQLLEPLKLDVFRNVVLHAAVGVRPLSHRVRKQVGLVVPHDLHQAHRPLELLLSLATKANDEVARECHIGYRTSDLLDKLEVALPAVVPSHLEEHVCVSTLRRHVYLLADIWFGGDDVQEGIWKVFGVWRRESESYLWSNIRDPIHELGKSHAIAVSELESLTEAS